MGKKGGIRHQKRLSAPRLWPIPRKHGKWAPKTSPGPHKTKESYPLTIILREILGIAQNRREVQYILHEGKVRVDGKVCQDMTFPLGLMDVIQIQDHGKSYRVLPTIRKGLDIHEIPEEETLYKYCQISNKKTLSKGTLQINLHDGRNIRIPVRDPTQRLEDVYTTKDVLKIALPSQEILEHYKFQTGVEAVVISGKNVGRSGVLLEIQKRFGPHASVAKLQEADGTTFETSLDYVFITKPSPDQTDTSPFVAPPMEGEPTKPGSEINE